MPDQAPPFRWAILGTGAVARKFVLDLRILGDQARVVTVASRAVENAERFARDLGISNVAPDYNAAVAADVDAVYIATPPALHEDHALMAIAAGKATLIEKPLALDAAAARRLIAMPHRPPMCSAWKRCGRGSSRCCAICATGLRRAGSERCAALTDRSSGPVYQTLIQAFLTLRAAAVR